MSVFSKFFVTPSQALRFGFFVLMCVGLALASVFLWFDKLDGGQWVTMCGLLFGTDRLANAAAETFNKGE